MRKKYIFSLCLPFIFLGLTAGCAADAPPEEAPSEATVPGETAPEEAVPQETTPEVAAPAMAEPSPLLSSLTPGAIQATITMESGDTITLELYPDIAPQSVRNFVYLTKQGFYDGLTFHRIMNDFMIQGGCPTGTGTGNAGYFIKGEFAANNFENDISHERGVLSMARRGDDYNSASAQFFITHGNPRFLDGDYAAFGRVIDGMDVVDDIAENTPVTDGNGSVAPENRPVIRSITIDSEVDLPPPDKIN